MDWEDQLGGCYAGWAGVDTDVGCKICWEGGVGYAGRVGCKYAGRVG